MSLTISKKTLDSIIGYEVSSEAIYKKKYVNPILPGVDSGITIGIGYDCGQTTAAEIEKDWKGFVSTNDLELIKKTAGLKKEKAAAILPKVKGVTVSFHDAVEVFKKDLKSYANSALKIYPGLDLLNPDAQGAILSLVYNRGASYNDTDRRKEMKELASLIKLKDYKSMAAQLRSMKRLWSSKTAKGLIIRREDEAKLIENSERVYSEDEKIVL